jgi:hypothetical protein
MSAEAVSNPVTNSTYVVQDTCSMRSWLLRRICSQNPFYLLSVCFVLHGMAHWFHSDSGASFSPWPLLGLSAGYTLLLAITGFVIIRFGKVWDDARSILLIILLLFVQLSLIFDETLVRDPFAGRLLLLTGWGFSIVLSEALLLGLRIRLPWLFRLPYHGLLALLFLYPVSLVALGTRLPAETVLWRIYLFPVVGAGIQLTLIPAIRRGSAYTKENGTPWQWPWYPWSLFVFLGVCLGFRAYALSLSFDPVIGESLEAALSFSSVFGIYFLVPLFLAAGVLLLEIGLAEKRRGVVKLAMLVPVVSLYVSYPDLTVFGPYDSFLRLLLQRVGSPVWLTLLGATAFYAFSALRGVRSAEQWLAITLLVLMRVSPQTIDHSTLSAPLWQPLLVLSVIELCLGLARRDSHLVFVGLCAAMAGLHVGTNQTVPIPMATRLAIAATLMMTSILVVGAVYRDDFAWLLRLVGAPLLVVATIAGFVFVQDAALRLPIWCGPAFVLSMALVGLAYALVVRMPLYRLSSFLCAASGSVGMMEVVVTYLIRESGWHGATSFVTGIGWLMLAVAVSSWKAGWLRKFPIWLRGMLVV